MATSTFHVRMGLLVLAAILIMAPAQAQDPVNDDAAAHSRDRARLHQEINGDIAGYPGLEDQHRERMQANLENCLRHGMTDQQIRVLFPEASSPASVQAAPMLGMQDRVLTVAQQDLPIGPMMSKIMEGRMKHVPDRRLEQAVDRMGHGIEASHRIMMAAIDGGVTRPATETEMHGANGELARCLWDGLEEHDLEHLADQARLRARDASCGIDDLVAASQAANRFHGGGMARHEAAVTAGAALHNGYSAGEMRALGEMAGAGHAEMVAHMHDWIHEGMDMDDMTRHMMEGGWMGPADMMGPGGHHPMDNMGMGGHGGDGGHGGGHDDGGMGGG